VDAGLRSSLIRLDVLTSTCEIRWLHSRTSLHVANALFRSFVGAFVVIKDRFIEQGIELGCSTFEIHRNERCFPDPHNSNASRSLSKR
jgi:hypothetical protein